MEFSYQIARSARRLRLATIICAGLVLTFAAVAVSLALGGSDLAEVRMTGEPLSAAVAAALLAAGLWRLIRMLRKFEAGETFEGGAIGDLRGFTLFTLLAALASVFLEPAMDLASALLNRDRHFTLTFGISGSDLFLILTSTLLFFVTRLLREAQRIAEENSQIV